MKRNGTLLMLTGVLATGILLGSASTSEAASSRHRNGNPSHNRVQNRPGTKRRYQYLTTPYVDHDPLAIDVTSITYGLVNRQGRTLKLLKRQSRSGLRITASTYPDNVFLLDNTRPDTQLTLHLDVTLPASSADSRLHYIYLEPRVSEAPESGATGRLHLRKITAGWGVDPTYWWVTGSWPSVQFNVTFRPTIYQGNNDPDGANRQKIYLVAYKGKSGTSSDPADKEACILTVTLLNQVAYNQAHTALFRSTGRGRKGYRRTSSH